MIEGHLVGVMRDDNSIFVEDNVVDGAKFIAAFLEVSQVRGSKVQQSSQF